MREFDYNVLNEIKQELRLIFEAHSLSYLKGKMRLFSVGHQRFFQAHEPGYEIWFGADEIDDTLNKLNALYRNGTPPNTPLILDPMLYRVQGQNISPVGSAIGWCTVLYPNADTIDETIINRIRDLRVFCSPFYSDEQQCSGLKIFAFLKEPILPNNAQFDQNGCMTNLTKALADLANVEDDAIFTNSYLLSGLNYRTVQGNYQHHSFKEVFGSIPVATPDQMRTQCIFPKHVQDAATCWNAYGRDVQLYERYGTNIDMLEANLQHKSESEKITDVIAKELRLIWRIQRSYGLNGEMRLFTAPHQKNWRSKEQGQEIWFGPEDDAVQKAAINAQKQYNAGKLPNSPMVLDPIVYAKDPETGKRRPLGSGIVWTTALALGIEKIEQESLARLKDVGVYAGPMYRGQELKGVKAFAMLDKAYMFDAEGIAAWEQHVKATEGETADAFGIPGCQEIFKLSGVSGKQYMSYYLLSGFEYLCGHGSFESRALSDVTGDVFRNKETMPEKRVSLKSLFDAATCWDAYDHHHSLWLRFGIDHDNLERNLRYYNMCARDFRLLDATDMKKFEQGNFHFEFLVENWLPRGSVTLFAATGGVGKSTIAHRLAMITSTDWEELGLDPPLWMGSQVTKEFRQGLVIYLSGEDGSAVFGARMKGFNFPEDPKRLMFLRQDFGIDDTGTPRTFAQFMHYLHKLPDVSLLIIDPANKYLSGIEDDAEAVSAFFDALDNFAIEKNCAVLVLHHLIKGAQPEHVREIAEILRGSEAFTDRPRVIIGMMLEGQYVVAGLAKNSLPPDLHMVQGERIFARDPVNLDLTLLPGERGIRSFTVSQTELEAIRAEKENHETEN